MISCGKEIVGGIVGFDDSSGVNVKVTEKLGVAGDFVLLGIADGVRLCAIVDVAVCTGVATRQATK